MTRVKPSSHSVRTEDPTAASAVGNTSMQLQTFRLPAEIIEAIDRLAEPGKRNQEVRIALRTHLREMMLRRAAASEVRRQGRRPGLVPALELLSVIDELGAKPEQCLDKVEALLLTALEAQFPGITRAHYSTIRSGKQHVHGDGGA